jgi:hypothetical protein
MDEDAIAKLVEPTFFIDLGSMLWFSPILSNFRRFLPIFVDFYQFSTVFTDFCRFRPIFGNFYRFSSISTNFRQKWRLFLGILYFDLYLRRFRPIFGEKMAFFLENQFFNHIFPLLFVVSLPIMMKTSLRSRRENNTFWYISQCKSLKQCILSKFYTTYLFCYVMIFFS